MSPLYFLPNSLSDPSFEAYLKETHRYSDYLNVKEKLLPKLFESIEQFSKGLNTRFLCVNRFEGQNPALRIQSPAGFVPDVMYVEFPPQHDTYIVSQTAQVFNVVGLDNLINHLRVLLVMGLAHWSPK
jgi:hypothetical protein